MRTVASLGSVLSKKVAACLESEFGWRLLNCVPVARSDLFVRYCIDKEVRLPGAEVVRAVAPAGTGNGFYNAIANMYLPEFVGSKDEEGRHAPFFENLVHERFDAFVLDGSADLTSKAFAIHAPATPTFHLCEFDGNRIDLPKGSFEEIPRLNEIQSARSWKHVIEFLATIQPRARIFFLSPSFGEKAFKAIAPLRALVPQLDVFPPIDDVAADADAGRTAVEAIRALAGRVFLSVECNWTSRIERASQGALQPNVPDNAVAPAPLISSDLGEPLKLSAANIFAPFVRRAMETPEHKAIVFVQAGNPTDMTCRSVLSVAVALGRRLQRFPRGSVVAIVLGHSPNIHAFFVGCVLYGHVPTILSPLTAKQDPNIFQSSMTDLFDRIEPVAVITSRSIADTLPNGPYEFIFELEFAEGAKNENLARIEWEEADVERDSVAFLQHSSGTTGLKKGVMLTHRHVFDQVQQYSEAISISRDDVVASWLPLYHDMGLLTAFVIPFVQGCAVISIDPLEWVARPTMLLDYIERYAANFVWLPNFAFHHIVRSAKPEQKWNLHSIKSIVSCSEPCRLQSFKLFLQRFQAAGIEAEKLSVSYALAENVFAATQTPYQEPVRSGDTEATRDFLSSGRPLPRVNIEIRAPDGSGLPEGELGEIFLKSSCLFSGYYKLPELSYERLVNGWYRTGDLGCLVRGELYVVGRTDDLLIINGKNLLAHEVEDSINHVAGVAPGRVLVGGQYDESAGTTRLIVLAEPIGAEFDERDLSDSIRKIVLAQCAVQPHLVRIVPKGFLVKSSSGKLSRRRSMEKFQQDYA